MTTVVDSSPSSTVRTAASFRQSLLDAFEADDQVELDVGELVELDLSFLQLVHAAREWARRSGKSLRLRAPAPAPVAALLERAGFLAAPASDDLEFWFHGERPQ